MIYYHSSTGDLTLPSTQCSHFESFVLPRLPNINLRGQRSLEFELPQSLLLAVGGCGIIGRRVALKSLDSSGSSVAEGVVGFNMGLGAKA